METVKKCTLIIVTGIIAFIILSCDRDVSTTITESPISNGMIVLDSEPQGAKIIINGFNTGKMTPDSITHLEEGSYIMTLRLYPFYDITDTLFLNEDNRIETNTNFYQDTRNYGKISIISYPSDALVFIDDSCSNLTTPVILENLWPGDYKITCTFPEHRALSSSVFVKGGEYKSLTLSLQDTSLYVDYNGGNSELNSMSTNCIEVDQDNVKWIGAYFNGLFKMVGETFFNYRETNSPLPSNSVHCIAIDELNRKWIGTRGGLAIIDGDNWTVYTSENSDMPQDFITAITFDNYGGAWIGATDLSPDKYLIHFDGNNWTSIPVAKYIVSLAVDESDRVWVGFDPGLEVWNGTNWEFPINDLSESHHLHTHPIESIIMDYDGSIWIGAGARPGMRYYAGGLYVFQNNILTAISLQEKFISHIHLAANGTKWISTLGDNPTPWWYSIGLVKVNPSGEVTNYDWASNRYLSKLTIWSSTDSRGNLWVATIEKGIIKVKGINL